MPWDHTTHQKIAMPMTAASVAQLRMGFKALMSSGNVKDEPSVRIHEVQTHCG